MDPEIILVREEKNYRVMYGRLRLAGALTSADEVCIDVKGEGKVKVRKSRDGLVVQQQGRCLPLL